MTDENGKIVITQADAYSEHVEDLLKRQRSLEGRGSSSGQPAKPWFFRNWIVFGLVGALVAFLGWALVEPHFYDTYFFQGKIEDFQTDNLTYVRPSLEFPNLGRPPAGAWLQIKGQKFRITETTSDLTNHRFAAELDLRKLEKGKEVGIYIDINWNQDGPREWLVLAVDFEPESTDSQNMDAFEARVKLSELLAFAIMPMLAGLLGLAFGAVEGLICHQPKRALLSAWIGALVGIIGGILAQIPSGLIYSLATDYAGSGSVDARLGFVIQVLGRAIAWAIAGAAMGLGQGLALKSERLVTYGLIGGVVGGLLGGMFFDPIDFFFSEDFTSAHISRMVGFTMIGLCVGTMIGIVELIARDAWLRMVEGPLAGKEFLFFKKTMRLGASNKCEVYLFNDPGIQDHHATLLTLGEDFEIQSMDPDNPVLVNQRPVSRARLRHGDLITMSRTSFIFEKKRG